LATGFTAAACITGASLGEEETEDPEEEDAGRAATGGGNWPCLLAGARCSGPEITIELDGPEALRTALGLPLSDLDGFEALGALFFDFDPALPMMLLLKNGNGTPARVH
jgi:hypothetical protein